MIKFTIAGNEEEFAFNIKFIRELDKTVVSNVNNIQFSVGVGVNINRFVMDGDVLALETILIAANRAANGSLNVNALDDFLDADSTDIDDISKQVMDALETGKFTKQRVAKARAEQEVAQAN